MFTPEYWQGRTDERLMSTPSSPSVQYVAVEKRVEVEVVKEVVKEVPKYRFIETGWEPHMDTKKRLDDQSSYPDLVRISAYRNLLIEGKKKMLNLAIQSLYPRAKAREEKFTAALEKYKKGTEILYSIGVDSEINFADEENKVHAATFEGLQENIFSQFDKAHELCQKTSEGNLISTAKVKIGSVF
jgi:hypothetical protein